MYARTALFTTAIVAALCGWTQLARFSATPGEQSAAPLVLPNELFTAIHAPVLLVFIHPQCSCTGATIQQLDTLFSGAPIPAQLVFAVYDSPALPRKTAFDPTAVLHQPYQLLTDPGGRLARQFGAATSGEVLLYSASRQLLFQGGITPERAHTGDSPGSRALRNALLSGRPQPGSSASPQSAVFGCPIFHLGHAG